MSYTSFQFSFGGNRFTSCHFILGACMRQKKTQWRQDCFCSDTCIILVSDPVQGHLTVPRILFNLLVGFLEEIISPNLARIALQCRISLCCWRGRQHSKTQLKNWPLENLNTERLQPLVAQRRYDMKWRFQMQGGKNWILLKEIYVNRFICASHWLEIWKNHLCPSMGAWQWTQMMA